MAKKTAAKKKTTKAPAKKKAPATKKRAKAPAQKKAPAAKKTAPAKKKAPAAKKRAPARELAAVPEQEPVRMPGPPTAPENLIDTVMLAQPLPPAAAPPPPPPPPPPPAPPPPVAPRDPAFAAADALARNFHGHAVPGAISELHRWAMGRLAERFAGRFEFVGDGADRAAALFSGNTDAAEQFCVFGADGDGSLFAFWTYAWRPIEEAPVVWLGPSGEGTVLASTPNDFLALLALDVADLGREGWRRPAPLNSPGHAAYAAWLEQRFGVVRPIDPAQVVERARRAHPDLAAWIHGVTSGSS